MSYDVPQVLKVERGGGGGGGGGGGEGLAMIYCRYLDVRQLHVAIAMKSGWGIPMGWMS